jgi:2-oxoglutarate ferredoxin oxidoreductase subunit alpha
VELTQLAFDLADRWRNPVLVYGDYLLAHTSEAVAIEPLCFPPLPAKDWAVDGSLGGSGRSRSVNPLGLEKGRKGIDPEAVWQRLAAKHARIAERETRSVAESCEDAELVVVAFGSLARFARHAVRELRESGVRVGLFRPVTLWPFPAAALRSACARARRVAVLEQNAGQMIDDVRLSLLGAAPVVGIGGISSDAAGFGVGSLLDGEVVQARIEGAWAGAAA